MKSKSRRATLAGSVAALLVLGGLMAAPANASEGTTPTPDPGSTNEYLFNYNGEAVTLDEGESAVFGMNSVPDPSAAGRASTEANYPGDCGLITVTASKGQYHYNIAMTCPANEFRGAFSITDLTSGFGGGSATVSGFSGTVTTSKLRNHRYSGTLTGASYFLGVQTSVTGPNNTIYVYNDF